MKRAKLFDHQNFDDQEAEDNEARLLCGVFQSLPFVLFATPVEDNYKTDR